MERVRTGEGIFGSSLQLARSLGAQRESVADDMHLLEQASSVASLEGPLPRQLSSLEVVPMANADALAKRCEVDGHAGLTSDRACISKEQAATVTHLRSGKPCFDWMDGIIVDGQHRMTFMFEQQTTEGEPCFVVLANEVVPPLHRYLMSADDAWPFNALALRYCLPRDRYDFKPDLAGSEWSDWSAGIGMDDWYAQFKRTACLAASNPSRQTTDTAIVTLGGPTCAGQAEDDSNAASSMPPSAGSLALPADAHAGQHKHIRRKLKSKFPRLPFTPGNVFVPSRGSSAFIRKRLHFRGASDYVQGNQLRLIEALMVAGEAGLDRKSVVASAQLVSAYGAHIQDCRMVANRVNARFPGLIDSPSLRRPGAYRILPDVLASITLA